MSHSYPIRQILVPTDMSEFGRAAIRYGEMLRAHLGASLTVLFARELAYGFVAPEFPYGYTPPTGELREQLESQLREHVREAVGEESLYDLRIVDGYPAQVILATAEEIDADLIVMGTHGRSGWRRALLGSVTERVLHHTSRRVLTVHENADPTAGVKTILCPVNLTIGAKESLEYASNLALSLDAELLVLHVAQGIEGPLDPDILVDFGAWVDRDARSRCRYSEIVIEGNAAEELLQRADAESIDLIVVSAEHKRFTDATVVGTTTADIVRAARQPVITVVRGKAEESRTDAA